VEEVNIIIIIIIIIIVILKDPRLRETKTTCHVNSIY